MNEEVPKLIVIVGETASGKSALALELAERFGGEIVCADALTVRRGVDIGTAKPMHRERARVTHHMLDMVEPCADFTAAAYKSLALKAIDDIAARGRLPVMVGGTGLYIDGVLFDYSFLPAGDRKAREHLNQLSTDELIQKITQQGLSLEGIDVRNKRRLIRVLETGGGHGSHAPMRENTLLLGVQISRSQLGERVERRIDAMLESDLEQEVRHLAETYGWRCEALKGIGYREWEAYFSGTQTPEETKNRIIKATLDLAKRQRTWFKRNNSIQWVNNLSEAVEIVTTFLSKTPN